MKEFIIAFVILLAVIVPFIMGYKQGYEETKIDFCKQEVSKARVLAPEQAIVLYEMCLSRRK